MKCPLCDAGYKPVERRIVNILEVPRIIKPKGNRKERCFSKYCWKRRYELMDKRFQQFVMSVERKHGLLW